MDVPGQFIAAFYKSINELDLKSPHFESQFKDLLDAVRLSNLLTPLEKRQLEWALYIVQADAHSRLADDDAAAPP